MKTYEYIRLEFDWDDLKQMNRLSETGWRVVHVEYHVNWGWEYKKNCNYALMERELPEKPFITEQRLDKTLDDILKQVVCCCGNYRHHGVDWMPEGSGEGKAEAKKILTTLLIEQITKYITGIEA